MSTAVTYDAVGATEVGSAAWSTPAAGYRRVERSVVVGHGDADWQRCCDAILRWTVKTRSGFAVQPLTGTDVRARRGADYRVTPRGLGWLVEEPVRVVQVVSTDARCGFAYGTLPGHPVSGEEAFIVSRDAFGEVTFTLRSLTRRGDGAWGLLFPVLLVVQALVRRRYLRALRV